MGVAVRGASGNSVIEISSIARPVTVRCPDARAVAAGDEQALLSAENTIALGCSPVSKWFTAVSDWASNTDTALPPHSETYSSFPSADTTQLYGSAVNDTVLTSWPLDKSIVDSVCAKTRVTYSILPSGLTASPPAKLWPLTAGRLNVRAGVRTPSA